MSKNYRHRISTTDGLRRKETDLLESDPELYFDLNQKKKSGLNGEVFKDLKSI